MGGRIFEAERELCIQRPPPGNHLKSMSWVAKDEMGKEGQNQSIGILSVMLKMLDLPWHWGTQRCLSAGDWHNHHQYRQWKNISDTRDKETWQETTYSLPLKHLKSASPPLSSIFLSIINNFPFEKVLLTFLPLFVTVSFICFQSIITAWASEIWFGHQCLFLPSPQGCPVSTSEIQYSFIVLSFYLLSVQYLVLLSSDPMTL